MDINVSSPTGPVVLEANLVERKSTAHNAVYELSAGARFPANGTITIGSLAAMKIHAKKKLKNWNINGNDVEASVSGKLITLKKATKAK